MSAVPAHHGGGEIVPLLRAAFQHASLGIAFYDRDLRFIAVNRAFAAISGVSAPGHEGRRLDEILPQHAPQIAPSLRTVFGSGRPLTGVALSGVRNQVVPRVGHWLASYEPVIEHDIVTAVVALVAEVTTQRRSDAILATQREVLERCVLGEPLAEVLDRITTAVTEHSVDRAIASILLLENGRLTHCSAPHLPRAYVEAVDGVPIGPSAGSCGTAAYRREPVIVRDIEHDPLWEQYRHIALSHGLRACWSVPIIGSGDEVLGTFALYHRTVCDPSPEDVSLTSLMARTAALLIEWWGGEEAHRRLLVEEQRARKAAEEANHGKDEFVATLTHELRTPLNAVIGWTRILRRAQGDPALTARALDAIERNAEAQARLITDLLDIARMARGGLRLEISEIDLRVVALAALDAVGPLADGKGLRLVADLPELGVPLAGDPTRLRQVIWNLLTNAVKFTPSGGEVRLEVRSLPDGARLVVRDTGIGIAPEILPQIFDRYTQADPGTGGLGLGLAIATSVAKLHGGSLRASSEGIGRGSQFELVLPCSLPATTVAVGHR